MNITLQFEAQLRQAAGQSSVPVSINQGATIMDAIQRLCETASVMKDRLLNEQQQLKAGLLLFVNEVPVDPTNARDQVLSDGDVILLLPPISGG